MTTTIRWITPATINNCFVPALSATVKSLGDGDTRGSHPTTTTATTTIPGTRRCNRLVKNKRQERAALCKSRQGCVSLTRYVFTSLCEWTEHNRENTIFHAALQVATATTGVAQRVYPRPNTPNIHLHSRVHNLHITLINAHILDREIFNRETTGYFEKCLTAFTLMLFYAAMQVLLRVNFYCEFLALCVSKENIFLL